MQPRKGPSSEAPPGEASVGPLLGYGRQCLDADDRAAVAAVLEADCLTQGPAVERFERALCEATGADHAVCVSSGTAALHLAYLALGVGPQSAVWTTANTFLATATAAVHLGARVSLCDVERATGNLDLERLERRLEREGPPQVVSAVHFAGLPCDMQRLLDLKRRFGFLLLEDAAHALGARYRVDERWWAVGAHPEVDATCLSFHPVKTITCGEGGAILTGDGARAARLRRLRSHGVARDYGSSVPFAPMLEPGFNYRLSDLHAALGASQTTKLGRFVERRRELARRYRRRLGAWELLAPDDEAREHAWHLFVVLAPAAEREPLMAFLRERGIGTQLHYAPLGWHPWFRSHLAGRSAENHVPLAEEHGRRALSLPLHPGLADEDVERVCDALEAWCERWPAGIRSASA